MEEIRPYVTAQDKRCVEVPAPPCGLVVFGASGDLAHRKLLVSLFELFRKELVSERFYVLGVGRKELTEKQFRKGARDAIEAKLGRSTGEELKPFVERLYYLSGDYDDALFYEKISKRVGELGKKYKVDGAVVFYLAVPPFLYGSIVEHLGKSGLSCGEGTDSRQRVRLVVEKPFGRDLQSAMELNRVVHKCFDESQVYRIDHYLGKETVQNILMFRFANAIFEPVWNRNYIDSIQITIAETVGVEHRAGYYDKSGALRDMFQNHMLAMLALVAMEPPISFEADHIRDEREKLLGAIRPFKLQAWSDSIIRAQYGPGAIDGKKVVGYRQEPGVSDNSETETFVAARLYIDNWRWQGIPFYLRTGKRLARKDTEVAITFKKVPHSMFLSAGVEEMPPNVLVLQIQPEEGISLRFQAKRPGSKLCMSTLNMNFSYKSVFGVDMPEAYERLLLDCMVGDQTLFTRHDVAEVSWKLLMPVLEAWEADDSALYSYPAGSESFSEADGLIESDGRKWRKLTEL